MLAWIIFDNLKEYILKTENGQTRWIPFKDLVTKYWFCNSKFILKCVINRNVIKFYVDNKDVRDDDIFVEICENWYNQNNIIMK